MAFVRTREALILTNEEREMLMRIRESKVESLKRIERAKILIGYAEGKSVSLLARELNTNRPRIERTIDKALEFGTVTALDDLPGKGKQKVITEPAIEWILKLRNANEDWSLECLAEHVRKSCQKEGFPALKKIAKGTISKILNENVDQSDLNILKVQVLFIPMMIDLYRQDNAPYLLKACLRRKTPFFTLKNRETELVEFKKKYKFAESISFMTVIDLLTGNLYPLFYDSDGNSEIIDFLQKIDKIYQESQKLKLFINPKIIHLANDLRKYLKERGNRFDVEFIEKNDQFVNVFGIILTKILGKYLRGTEFKSNNELKKLLKEFIEEFNITEVVLFS